MRRVLNLRVAEYNPVFDEMPDKGEKVEGSECCLPEFDLNSTAGTSQCEDLSKEEPDKGQHEDLGREEADEGDSGEGDELSRGGENKGKSMDNVLDDDPAIIFRQSNGKFLGLGSDMHNKSMGLDISIRDP